MTSDAVKPVEDDALAPDGPTGADRRFPEPAPPPIRPDVGPHPATAGRGGGSPPTAGGTTAEPRMRAVLEAARQIVAPTTLLTAVLFYFGWVYTNARALYFGIDPSALGFSTQDYLLRSIEPVFLPLAIVLIAGLVVLWAHGRLQAWAERHRHESAPAIVAFALGAFGLLLLVTGASGWAGHPILGTNFLITPLGLGLGPAIVFYAARFHRRLHNGPGGPTDQAPAPPSLAAASPVLVSLLVVLSLFAAVDDWADAAGRRRARPLAGAPASPAVVGPAPAVVAAGGAVAGARVAVVPASAGVAAFATALPGAPPGLGALTGAVPPAVVGLARCARRLGPGAGCRGASSTAGGDDAEEEGGGE